MKLVVIGAAGQAREASWYIDAMGHTCLGYVVSDLARLGEHDSRERVLGDMAWIDAHVSEIDGFVLGIGSPAARARVAGQLSSRHPNVPWPSIVHPSAVFDRASVRFGRGVMIGAGAVVTVNVQLEDFSMINFGATIGHDSRVGRATVVNPGANVSGGVDLGDEVLIGAGAVVLQYRKVGRGGTVGAGAVVTKDVPDQTTVVGVPARPRPTA